MRHYRFSVTIFTLDPFPAIYASLRTGCRVHTTHTHTHTQLWKTHRIGKGDGDSFSLHRLVTETEALTAVGVELSAGLGAWCFFVGTGIYEQGPLEGPGSVVPLVLQVRISGALVGCLWLGVQGQDCHAQVC